MKKIIDLNQPQYFEIRIAGHLSEQRSRSFTSLEITHLPCGETLIRGLIKDQPQLFGLLIRIRDLGIPLLSVNILPSADLQTGGVSQ